MRGGHYDIARVLLDQGVDVNAQSKVGNGLVLASSSCCWYLHSDSAPNVQWEFAAYGEYMCKICLSERRLIHCSCVLFISDNVICQYWHSEGTFWLLYLLLLFSCQNMLCRWSSYCWNCFSNCCVFQDGHQLTVVHCAALGTSPGSAVDLELLNLLHKKGAHIDAQDEVWSTDLLSGLCGVIE